MGKLKTVEHGIKAVVFRSLAGFLKRGDRAFQPLDGAKVKKVLFLRPEKIGDMVISFPVFDGLRQKFPHIKQSILGSPKNLAIIKDDPRFDRVFLYRKNIWKDASEVRAMRREHFDCIIDMICDDSVTALMLSQSCAPGKPRIGVGKVKYRQYYDFNYDHRKGNTGHIIQNTLALLSAFDIDPAGVEPYAQPHIAPEVLAEGRRFVASLKSGTDRSKVIGYNLSAGSPTRIVPAERSIDLVTRLISDNPGSQVLLLVAPADRWRALAVEQAVSGDVKIVPEGQNLMQASAIVAHLDLLISPDTSMIHIARSFHVPVVGLYSRFMKNFLLWRPFGQEHGAVLSGNDDNIFDITVDQILQAVRQVADEIKAEAR
jgi:ADP-heptose:LPS heptosyltransferase